LYCIVQSVGTETALLCAVSFSVYSSADRQSLEHRFTNIYINQQTVQRYFQKQHV